MKRPLILFACCLAVGVGSLLAASPAMAVRQFRDEFYVLYLDEQSDDPEVIAYVELVKSARCDLCHVGRKRENRNVYGQALSELLDHGLDKEDKEKIQEALKAVAGLPSIPKDSDAPTFGKLIEQGKLPGGEPEE